METRLLAYCWIVVIATFRAGSESCVDTLGDFCKGADCSQHGIDVTCAKTCATCREEDCAKGYYRTAERICESCATPPLSHRTDSYNSSCLEECPDGKWGLDCNTNCGIGCTSACRRWTGSCHGGCKRCYLGATCNQIHVMCICDQTAGKCMCKEGHYGETCYSKCSLNCISDVCDTTGTCSRGCKEGWSGKMCDHSCANCLLSKCLANGTCTQGCKAGFYGNLCQVACNKQCNNITCRWNTGECDEGCTAGWYGGRCDIRCPGNCASELCDRTDGACSHCKNGFMGSNCNTPCPHNCASKTCEQNGMCVKCKVGYSGSHCDTPCPDNCATDACEQHGAACTGCKPGYKGPHCDTRCPDKCSSCHQHGNMCVSCNANWYGGTCGKSCNTCLNGTCNINDGACLYGCKPGSYGHHCNRTCNENCFKTECFRDSGNCTHGCKDGWWGPQCNSRCPSHCARCDRVDAACLECEENYYGENCSNRCSPRCGSCDRTGHCLTCAEGWEGDNCHVVIPLHTITIPKLTTLSNASVAKTFSWTPVDPCTTIIAVQMKPGLGCEQYAVPVLSYEAFEAVYTKLDVPDGDVKPNFGYYWNVGAGCCAPSTESKSLQPSTLIWTSVVAILLLIIAVMAIKMVSKRTRAVYLSTRFEDNVYSSVDDASLYDLAEPRDSTGSQYATIPDAAVSLEDRGYEQLRQASPCTGYTTLY